MKVIIVVAVKLVPPVFLVAQIWQREPMLTYNDTVPLKSRDLTITSVSVKLGSSITALLGPHAVYYNDGDNSGICEIVSKRLSKANTFV